MAYTYRLSRRLAQIHITLLAITVLGCNDEKALPLDPISSSVNIATDETSEIAVSPSHVTVDLTNEPSGFVSLTERLFDAKVENGWKDRKGSVNFTIVQSSTAPKSPNQVGKAYYPAGFKGGTAPLNTWYPLAQTKKNLYVSFWVRFSSNWRGHPSGMNKIMHFWIGGTNKVVFKAMGSGSNPMLASFHLQGINNVPSSINLTSTTSNLGEMKRGQWHQVEIIVRANTGNNKDGTVQWWLDGNLIGNFQNNLGFVTSPMGHSFTEVSWSPTWGGVGGTVTTAQDMQVDHVYISGL